MMLPAVAATAWLAVALAVVVAVMSRRALGHRETALARACHEVRGPLAAARLGIEAGMASGAASPARLRALELELARATVALDDLQRVGDELDRPAVELVDVEAWLRDSVEAWRLVARACGMEICLQWRGPGVLVRGQRARLAQVTGNLIANAIEHGDGFVQVSGQAEQGRVRIEVLDGGPGLTASVGDLLGQEAGRRLLSPRRPGSTGTRGHGLAISRAVVAQHGGRLAAAPSPHGARLVLELPLAGARPESDVGRS